MPTNQTAETPVTMEVVQAMMNSIMDELRRDMQAMTHRLTTRLDEVSRARSSSPISATQQIVTSTPPQSTQSAAQPITAQPIIAQSAVASLSEDKRWRPEEIGQFDGTGDVIAFVDRIRSVVTLKASKIVQANLITLLKDVAFNWY